jgi:hypothetical protein
MSYPGLAESDECEQISSGYVPLIFLQFVGVLCTLLHVSLDEISAQGFSQFGLEILRHGDVVLKCFNAEPCSSYGTILLWCTFAMCWVNLMSFSLSATSSKMSSRSNLDRSVAGSLMFFCGLSLGLYLLYRGLATASTEVLAFSVVVSPTLAMKTVCCS